ncbi:uncharacterized protein LOC143193053 [Rhynchophorus ferrugineus]|uniref:uncharacterized protein LOC143193053 n=1 Tax=Rhynchophorus ferrugineus TaxID=354439 RepID=UPI003FCCFF42
MQKTLKWSPAQPLKRADNIISSKARETGDFGFTPTYLSEPKEDMHFLMSNEYMRIWFRERAKYEKGTYSKEAIIKEESKIKRRFVQRMMTYKKPNKNQFLEEKINQPNRLPSKKNDDYTHVDYTKMKYKPQCLKRKGKSIGEKNSKENSKDEKKVDQTETHNEDNGKNNLVYPVNITCCCTPILPCDCTKTT